MTKVAFDHAAFHVFVQTAIDNITFVLPKNTPQTAMSILEQQVRAKVVDGLNDAYGQGRIVAWQMDVQAPHEIVGPDRVAVDFRIWIQESYSQARESFGYRWFAHCKGVSFWDLGPFD